MSILVKKPDILKYPIICPQFFTATILNWESLLLTDEYKEIIIKCLQFLVQEKRIQLFGFVIMSNHVHFIWQPSFEFSLQQVQHSFMTFTARGLKNMLGNDDPEKLEKFRVNKYDRTYQIWKREPLSIELSSSLFLQQKLNYIHNNPIVAGLVSLAEEYKYSSAKFYLQQQDIFKMLTHYQG